MKTIYLAAVSLMLGLVSCGEKVSRRDAAEDWLTCLQTEAGADYRVDRLRYELESGPDVGKTALLAGDLAAAKGDMLEAGATERAAYSKWLDVEEGKPDFSTALAGYREALIKARVVAVRGDAAEFERLRGMDFVGVMTEFRGR